MHSNNRHLSMLPFGVSAFVVLAFYSAILWWLGGKDRISSSIEESQAANLLIEAYTAEASSNYPDMSVWLERKSIQCYRGFWLSRRAVPGYWLVVKFSNSIELSIVLNNASGGTSLTSKGPGKIYYAEQIDQLGNSINLTLTKYGLKPRSTSTVHCFSKPRKTD